MTRGAPPSTVSRVKVVSDQEVEQELGALPGSPRVVANGNMAPPSRLLEIADRALEGSRLFMLAAQGPLPTRPEVIFETAFVGPGMRDAGGRLDYLRCASARAEAVRTSRVPDVVLVHTSPPAAGKVSLGIEVNVLPAAIEQVRRRGGLVDRPIEPEHALHARRLRVCPHTSWTSRSRSTSRCRRRPPPPATSTPS